MKKNHSIVILLLLCLVSCNRVPSGIIKPKAMAELMADVHTAEAVIDMNHNAFVYDSAKQVLKESVYAKHGVSAEQVDSSLAYYGRNMTKYMDVYDRAIAILERRLEENGRVAAEAAMSMAGDSVDVWTGARFISFNDRMPSKLITYNYQRDHNWESGDVYVWRAKFNGSPEPESQWIMAAEYTDGTVEYITHNTGQDGWREMSIHTDTLRTLTRLYGVFEAVNRPGSSLIVDSIEMVRKRLDREQYNRRFSVRRLRNVFPEVEVKNDSI